MKKEEKEIRAVEQLEQRNPKVAAELAKEYLSRHANDININVYHHSSDEGLKIINIILIVMLSVLIIKQSIT